MTDVRATPIESTSKLPTTREATNGCNNRRSDEGTKISTVQVKQRNIAVALDESTRALAFPKLDLATTPEVYRHPNEEAGVHM